MRRLRVNQWPALKNNSNGFRPKEAELAKFKFDGDTQRAERIKSLVDALTIGVPQTTADLSKFFAESEFYPDDVKAHMDEQIKMLADLCGDYLSKS